MTVQQIEELKDFVKHNLAEIDQLMAEIEASLQSTKKH